MSRTLCQVTTPYEGAMVNLHIHRCMHPITTSALGGTHLMPHECHTCGIKWGNVGVKPTGIVLCGVQAPSTLVPPLHTHTTHTCNIHVQDTDGVHLGEHHCNCGAGFTVPAPTTQDTARALDEHNAGQARCIDCRRMRPLTKLVGPTTARTCRNHEACVAYTHAVKGGTPSDGTQEQEGTPAQSLFSLSDVESTLDEIRRDVADRYERLVTVFDRWRARVDNHADVIEVNGASLRGLFTSVTAIEGRLSNHGQQLQDRKNDYDAVLQRLAAIVERIERVETLAAGQHWRREVENWKAYTNRRFDSVNKVSADMRKRLVGHADELGELSAAVARLVEADDAFADQEHGGDWCPAQTGVIAEDKRPSLRHMLHTCIVLGAHAYHRCSCGTQWISQTSPVGAESDSGRPDAPVVTGGPATLNGRPVAPTAGARSILVELLTAYAAPGVEFGHKVSAPHLRGKLRRALELLDGVE